MFVLDFESIKGAAHPIYFPPSALFPSRLFKCELFGRTNVCLLLNIMELDGSRLLVLKLPK